MTQCTAKSKRTQVQCQQQAMHGSTKCYHHGGATPRGLASVHTKHGKFSSDLPTRLIAKYEQAVADPELLSVRHELALLGARLSDVLGRVDTGESGATWAKARDTYDALIDAMREHDAGKQSQSFRELDRLIGKGLSDYAAWREIQSLIEQIRKLSESEQKRLVAAQLMISSEQAMSFTVAMLSIIKQHVSDRTVLNNIQLDVTALLSKRSEVPSVE